MKYVKLALFFVLSVFIVSPVFSAPTIDVSWFSQNDLLNVQNAAKECAYGDRLTVPSSNPTRSGYDFNGWTVGYRDMCSFNYAYDSFAERKTASDVVGNLWINEYKYGSVTGEFLCSADGATNSADIGNPSCASGDNCWCRVTGYKEKDNNYLINGPWVFLTRTETDACGKECARSCSNFDKIADEKDFRAALYNMVVERESIIVTGFISESGMIAENQGVYGLSEPNTWGASFSAGKVTGVAMCSITTGTAARVGNPSSTNGGNCWCRATGYTPSGETLRTTSSTQWVFQSSIGSGCNVNCAENCVKELKNNIVYVPVMLNGVSTSYYPSVLSTLSVSTNGTGACYAKSLDGGEDHSSGGVDASRYGLTMAGEWGTSFSYGSIRGTSLCSSATGTQYAVGLPNLTQRGNNCWCRVTGFIPTGGQAQTISTSSWVYGLANQDITLCESECSYWCATTVGESSNARVAMFEQPIQSSVASAYGFISDNVVLSENVNSFNLTAPGTWGVDFGDNKIIGVSMCDSVTAGNKGDFGRPSGDNNGDACWCRVTDYIKSGTSVSATSSEWVYHSKDGACKTQCAKDCARSLADTTSVVHTNMLFGVRASNPTGSCVPVPYLWSVDTSIDGDESGSLGNNGTTHSNEVTYGLTNPGTWGVTFDYGVVLGESSCSSVVGSNDLSVSGANTMSTTDTGSYCWCRVTEHNPDDGNPIQSLTSSSWVFVQDFESDNEACASRCASRCATLIYGESVVRDALYTNTGL